MNRFEKRSQISYDRKAEKYDSTFDGKFTVKFKQMMCETVCIQQGAQVLDVACGNGRLLQMFAQKASFCGYGVDLSEKMVEQAQQLNPQMQFWAAGCDALPFEKQQMDVMTVCAAFHHFPDVERFAEEAARVIKPTGMLYIAELYLPDVLRRLCNPFVRFSRAGDVKIYAPGEIIALFEAKGFAKRGVEIRGGVQMISLQKV